MRFIFPLTFLIFALFSIKQSTAAVPAEKSFVETLVEMSRKEKPQDKPKPREKLVFKQLSRLFPDVFQLYSDALFTNDETVFTLPNVMHESSRKARAGIQDPQFSITLTTTCFDKPGKPLFNACPFEFKDKNGEVIQGKIYISSDLILPNYLQSIRANRPLKIIKQAQGVFPFTVVASTPIPDQKAQKTPVTAPAPTALAQMPPTTGSTPPETGKDTNDNSTLQATSPGSAPVAASQIK